MTDPAELTTEALSTMEYVGAGYFRLPGPVGKRRPILHAPEVMRRLVAAEVEAEQLRNRNLMLAGTNEHLIHARDVIRSERNDGLLREQILLKDRNDYLDRYKRLWARHCDPNREMMKVMKVTTTTEVMTQHLAIILEALDYYAGDIHPTHEEVEAARAAASALRGIAK